MNRKKQFHSIKITIYRLAQKSKLVDYLCLAAENNIEVTVLIELRARFDEQNNIDWSERLEDAGCTVLYGIEGYKVHSKICLITKRKNNEIRYYTQIGSGNYNESTSKQYTDLSLKTSNSKIGKEAVEFFKNLFIGNLQGKYSKLLVAPSNLKSEILRLISEESSKGEDGYIFMKMNSLTDIDIIHSLSKASQAKVRIELIIRGICSLVPQVPGYTENITIRSIVGQFLEHSRIYIFGKKTKKVYRGSADMMTRNTEFRVEILVPVTAVNIRKRIFQMVSVLLADNTKARILKSGGVYEKFEAMENKK